MFEGNGPSEHVKNNGFVYGWGLPGADEYRGFRLGSKLVITEGASLRTHVQTPPVAQRAGGVSSPYRCQRQSAGFTGRPLLSAKVLAATGDVETVQPILRHT